MGLCRSKNPLDFPRLCATFILMMLAVESSTNLQRFYGCSGCQDLINFVKSAISHPIYGIYE